MVTRHKKRDRAVAIVSFLATDVILAIVLIVTAGTIEWVRGWWFFVLFSGAMTAAAIYLWEVNPVIFAVRRRIGPGTKGWDLVLMPLTVASILAVIVVGALDDGRFHWSQAGTWVVVLGSILFVAAFWIETWAQAVNRFFEPTVRIQTERDHELIDTGPYAIVRHPGYIGASVLAVGMALTMGSLWALVPATVLVGALLVRTILEDETLARELAGYREYRTRVRYRWIPGVW
jgi:protein-S-isoprenylcysteine O-methyltransferase Ste14